MIDKNSLTTLFSLAKELGQIIDRLEKDSSAAPLELALMSRKTVELYETIKKLEQSSQGAPAAPVNLRMVPEPVRQQSMPSPPAPQTGYTKTEKQAPEQVERKREKLQRLEEPTSAPAPQISNQEQKKPAISEVYAQAREKAHVMSEKSINERMRTQDPKGSLNERFAGTQVKKKLADKLKLSPIADLNKAMSVNQKALFAQNLFRGDDKEFRRVVAFVNGSSSFSEAKFYLQSEIAPMNGWKEDDPLVQDFLELVYRKFL
jgi:hypothetical protein